MVETVGEADTLVPALALVDREVERHVRQLMVVDIYVEKAGGIEMKLVVDTEVD